MRKVTKVHHGKVILRGRSQNNLRVCRYLTMRENGVGPNGTEAPGGESEWIKGQHSTTLNQVVQRNAGGAQETWKNVTVVVDSGAAEKVLPRSMFPEMSTEETERSDNGEGFKGQDESTSSIMGSRSCPSELLKDLYVRARGRLQT